MVDGAGRDEPDARWDVTFQRCVFVDIAGFSFPNALAHGVGPALPDKHLLFDYTLADSSITDCVSMTPGTGGFLDAVYYYWGVPKGSSLAEGCRFERSGNFNPASTGTGGGSITPPSGGSIVPSWNFTRSEWVANAAFQGPALHVYFGNFNVQLLQCLFRCARLRPNASENMQ